MSGRTLAELSETISRLSETVEARLKERNLVSPTVNDEKSCSLAEVDAEAAGELAEAARELETLVQAPRQTLGFMGLEVHDSSSLGVIVEFDIPRLIPLGGSASFAELSKASGLDEDRLTRILRYAMVNFVFREEPAGVVRHTALSAHLAQSPAFCDFLRTIAAVFNPANISIPIALRRYPNSSSMVEAAHNVARHTDDTFYAWLDANPDLRVNFDKGMEGISRGGQRLQDTDLRAYPWAALGDGAKIVDVGGSGGHFSRDLALMFPSFSIVVQDLPSVIDLAVKANEASPVTNVSYQAHSFFDEQPVVGAQVYFLRHIFHNHPEKECIDILKALLPALRPGARVLISEYIVPPAEELSNGLGTKAMRQMDLMTMALFNAKERTRVEYSAIFQKASPDLVLKDIHQLADDPRSSVFEAVYQG